ncbi:hypothetical protein O0I10_009914 [Lichtheimia ornata]|uniref:Uncharacterized protein n=1 Tax=Lichtheimia ornata TaxID=688661 RepID=A0AAD7XVF0_9FUNG|nr:uncharacterized protein O0I10_009914 [Lichtheimia ornata]KAJ8654473.1 hypothetical protein O0I10_009914 [Lichtheimia ornata]
MDDLFVLDTNTGYEKQLHSIGRRMLLEYDLVIGDKHYDMLEVEAYLNAPGHPDPFVHAHPFQKRSGYWFFHRAGMSSTLRNGSRKGVDITVGKAINNSTGGLLIRAVEDKETGRVIEGPSLLVDEILLGLGGLKTADLADEHWDCWTQENRLYLKKKATPYSQPVHQSCRVGLRLSHHNLTTRLQYVGRPYRYVMKPWLLKKGRVWTLFGLMEEKLTIEEMVRLTLMKKTLMPKYKSEYDIGQKDAIKTIKQCVWGGKDIVAGNALWKTRVMSAVRWWERQAEIGNIIEIEKK